MWIVLLMYALFASTFTAGKHILLITSPFFFTGVRMLAAGAVLLLIQLLRDPSSLKIRKEFLPYICLLGAFNVFITNAFEYWGMQELESAKACLIYSLSPLFSIVLSYYFFGERMNGLKWLGIGVGFLGFIPIFLLSPTEESLLKVPTIYESAVMISALTSVIGWMTMKKLVKNTTISFVTANLYSFLLAGVLALVWAFFTEPLAPLPVYPLSTFLPEMFFILLAHNVICYNLYSYSLSRFSVSFMTFAGFVTPLFAEFFGWFFLGESCSWLFFASLGVIIFGLVLYAQGEKRATHEALTTA